jgi:acetoin utilization deacetylase AcuC-like enzyme
LEIMSGATPSGLLVSTHDVCWLHDAGARHPERADRLTAVRDGLTRDDLRDAVEWVEAPLAERAAIERVHPPELLNRLNDLCVAGGGMIDADTVVSVDSCDAALRAAGAGLDLIERLQRGEAAAGWSVVRPPGHHANATRQMGFCLINNVAVAARSLAAAGERVAIVDIDAHHGNGTQDIFYDDPDVLFVSFHQYPWYPYTGRPDEIGSGDAAHSTVNIALPAGTTGEVYRLGIQNLVAPAMQRFQPTWLLISAGFDAHRADPITELGLTSADFADIVADLLSFAPPGRRLLFLEGGYDLQALADSAAAVAAVVLGERHRPELPSSGGPGARAVELACEIHRDAFAVTGP